MDWIRLIHVVDKMGSFFTVQQRLKIFDQVSYFGRTVSIKTEGANLLAFIVSTVTGKLTGYVYVLCYYWTQYLNTVNKKKR